MLSFSKGIPIARIEGGKYDGKIIHLFDPDNKDYDVCCEKCSKKCRSRRCCADCKFRTGGCKQCGGSDIEQDNPIDIMNYDDIRHYFGKDLNAIQMDRLIRTLKVAKRGGTAEDFLEFKDILNEFKKRAEKEIVINDKGRIIILPNPNEEIGQRVFCAGPSGSGKSTIAGQYIEELMKMFPKKEFILFSKVEEDEALDHLKPNRVNISKKLIDYPIKTEDLKNSITLFDDIDKIQDPKIVDSLQRLRNAMLETGRHDLTYTICCGHQIANNAETKVQLNECDCVIFFPRAGVHGIKYFLTSYCGLSKKQIEKIIHLPSRWVAIFKIYPMYVLYEKGCFLLNSMQD